MCVGIANVARSYIAIELPANRAIQLLCGSFDLIILQPGQSQSQSQLAVTGGGKQKGSSFAI